VSTDAAADPARIAADQAAQLPGKRAEDAAWAGVVVPDEAVARAAGVLYDQDGFFYPLHEAGETTLLEYVNRAKPALAAAAPALVAANQPEPAHEVQCPACDAIIRARMADQHEPSNGLRSAYQESGELREVLARRLRSVHANIEVRHPDNWCGDATSACSACTDGFSHLGELAGHLAAGVEAFVAAQCAAARADERAKVLALHRRYTRHREGYCLACHDADGFSEPWPCPTVRALGVEGDHA
jgi:hypothetical protein